MSFFAAAAPSEEIAKRRRIDDSVVITAEVLPPGNLGRIGGLEQKLDAALWTRLSREGVNRIILCPAQLLQDGVSVREWFSALQEEFPKIELELCDHITTALRYCYKPSDEIAPMIADPVLEAAQSFLCGSQSTAAR